MKKAIIIFLLIIAGCNTPADKPIANHFDTAIENLSLTTQQLESVRREKDFFVKALEDFEQQKTEYGLFLDPGRLGSQMQDFTGWHRDITQRERELEIQHAINVFAAHNQVAKRKSLDPNQTALASPAP
jgi:hypothetical protein